MIRGASLVFQWLRICLLMLGTQLRSLVGELIPTWLGATSEPKSPCILEPEHATTKEKPAHHKERSRMLQLKTRQSQKKKKKLLIKVLRKASGAVRWPD